MPAWANASVNRRFKMRLERSGVDIKRQSFICFRINFIISMDGYFLAIGELLADITTDDDCDGLAEARSFRMMQGGSPANVAANIKYLGGHAALVSALGNDGIGKFLLAAIKKSGLSINSYKFWQITHLRLYCLQTAKEPPILLPTAMQIQI